mgnify:CR=1 FL=1
MAKAKNRGGRPHAEIDKDQFEKLCAIQATITEIADWFFVDVNTLMGWCKRTYKKSFSEIFRQKRSRGKISLRRSLWQGALEDKNVVCKIFLAKNHLGMSDDGAGNDEESELDLDFSKHEKD